MLCEYENNSSLNYEFQMHCKDWYISFYTNAIIDHNYLIFIYFLLTEATVIDFKQGLVHQLQTYSYVSKLITVTIK